MNRMRARLERIPGLRYLPYGERIDNIEAIPFSIAGIPGQVHFFGNTDRPPLNMKLLFRLLGVSVGLAASFGLFGQAADDVPLTFTRLDLKDGRKLKNVVVKTYDAKTERLLIIVDGKATTIPIALVPPPFNEQLKAAPASGASVNTVATPSKPVGEATTAAVSQSVSNANRGLPPPRHQVATPTPPPTMPQRKAPAVDPQLAPAILSRHQAAARARAERYFRYEHQVGSNSISVTALDFELSRPKPVPGWEGRYETTGKAYLEFYDSKGRSFQRTTSTFEITTEEKLGEEMKVIDFSRKS